MEFSCFHVRLPDLNEVQRHRLDRWVKTLQHFSLEGRKLVAWTYKPHSVHTMQKRLHHILRSPGERKYDRGWITGKEVDTPRPRLDQQTPVKLKIQKLCALSAARVALEADPALIPAIKRRRVLEAELRQADVHRDRLERRFAHFPTLPAEGTTAWNVHKWTAVSIDPCPLATEQLTSLKRWFKLAQDHKEHGYEELLDRRFPASVAPPVFQPASDCAPIFIGFPGFYYKPL